MEESASPGSPLIRSRIPDHAQDILQLRFPKAGCILGEAKRAFHNHARRRLKDLADALGLAPQSYDLRSNAGGNRCVGRGHDARRSRVRSGVPAGNRSRYRAHVPDVPRSQRLSWRSQSLRLPRPSEPARRPGAPHQGGMPSLISLRLILYKRRRQSSQPNLLRPDHEIVL